MLGGFGDEEREAGHTAGRNRGRTRPRSSTNAQEALAQRSKPHYFNVMAKARSARFPIGAVVKHRLFPFRGVGLDIDPEFANTEEWDNAIPAEIRPRKDQPFYHLVPENAEVRDIASGSG